MKRTLAAIVLVGAAVPHLAVAQADYTKADARNGVEAPVVLDGGDTCGAAAAVVGPLPFADTGTTVGASNTVSLLPLACNGNYTAVNGPDKIYTFTTSGGAGMVGFDVTTTEPNYDMSIYVLGTCDDGNSCIVGADDCFAANAAGNPCGASSDESIAATAFADGTYFFYVDSFYSVGGPRAAGPFALDVTGTLPVELIGFEID